MVNPAGEASKGDSRRPLVRSARTAPAPLAAEIGALAHRLRAHLPTELALRAFADDVDDAAGDRPDLHRRLLVDGPVGPHPTHPAVPAPRPAGNQPGRTPAAPAGGTASDTTPDRAAAEVNGYLAAATGGAMAGGGLASAARCLLPAPPPRLTAALAALERTHQPAPGGTGTWGPAGTAAESGWTQRAGRLLARALPSLVGWRTRPADLAILGLPAQTLLGRQGLLALFGLLLPSLAIAPLLAVGVTLPFTIPAAASLLRPGLITC